MVVLKTFLNNLELSSPLLNASGPKCTSFEELSNLMASSAGAISLKSATIKAREGNPEPRYVEFGLNSINSMGLPNPGYKVLAGLVPDLKKISNKPIIASVSGFSKQDYFEMINKFDEKGADVIELNLSCPNVIGKPQVGYDFEYSRELLLEARDLTKKTLAVKLPPYLDLVHREQMSELLLESKVEIVSLINSIGNALVIDVETELPLIKPKHGLGGLGGEMIKPVALSNVFSFHELLKNKVQIIGVGGVNTGRDAFEHILCGADAVGIATAYAREGVQVFEKINEELKELMESKGYNSISEFKGKLKEIK